MGFFGCYLITDLMMLQVTDGVTADGNTMSLLTVTGATFADNGVYTCTVTFGFYGAATAAEVSNLLPITTTRVILYGITLSCQLL